MKTHRIASIAIIAATLYLLANAPVWAAPPKPAFPTTHPTKADFYRCFKQHDCSALLRRAFPKGH